MSDERLRLLVERIERISEEIAELQADRRDIYAEAKATGYDVAILRKVIARRKLTGDERQELDALVEAYEAALTGALPAPTSDPVLAAAFAPPKPAKTNARARRIAESLLWATTGGKAE